MPTLTRTGLAALFGLVALAIGAGLTGHALLGVAAVVAGSLMLGCYALLSLLLFELKRERLEFTWKLSALPVPTAGGEAHLELRFRNRSPFSWRGVRAVAVGSDPLVAPPASIDLPRYASTRATLIVRVPRAGHYVAHGAVLEFEDAAGLFRIAPYCARRLVVRVRPAPAHGILQLRRGGVQGGARRFRQRGLGTDLREIRELRHGDSFRDIAWKASARRRQLMVREFESEVRVPLVLAVDVSPSMREGALGATPLDEALRAAHSFAAGALGAGDPVGLVTFSSRRLESVACDVGARQLGRIEEMLLDAAGDLPVEDVSDGRLGQLRAAAQFLIKETALRVKPDLSVPGDEMLVSELVERTLEKLARRGLVGALPEHEDERLRVFLRYQGLVPEMAPLQAWGPRERGLSGAMLAAAADPASPRVVLVLTDLRGVRDRSALARTIARLRPRVRVSFVVPALRGADGEPEKGRAAQRAHTDAVLHDLAAREERRVVMALCAKAGAEVLLAPSAGDLRTVLTRAAAAREFRRAAM